MEHIRQFDWTRPKLIGQGLLVGVLTGGVVAAFRWCITVALDVVRNFYQHAGWPALIGWGLLSVAVAGFIGWLLTQEPNIAGSGIPQVEGQLQGTMDFSWWQILWRKFVSGVLGLGAGLMLGREGPSIQLGAAVGQGVAETQHKSGSDRRILIAAGAAGGLAAAFNAPIAGVLFVLEEVYHNFSPLVWVTSLGSAIGANFVSLYIFGEVPVLHLVYHEALPVTLYGHLVALGIVLGLLGLVYQRTLLAMPRLYALTHIPRAFQGVVPFLLIIPVGILAPAWLGGGNGLILAFGKAMPTLGVLLAIFAVRFLFSMVAYGSGLPGGIFLPILTLGAVIGAIYGTAMSQLGWLPRGYIMNLIIFAMAGYFAAIGKAPFTAILLITEMVGNLTNLMAMAVLCLVAFTVVDVCGGAPIYASLLARIQMPDTLAAVRRPERLEVPVFAGSALDGGQVRDFTWPKAALLTGIRRGETVVLPHGDTVIQAGDTLLILTDARARSSVRTAIRALALTPE